MRYLPWVAPTVAVLLLVLGGGFFYNNVWNVPDVRYTILPVYDVPPTAISGVVIENRGRRTAEELWVKCQLGEALAKDVVVKSDEPYTLRDGGKVGDDHFSLWLDRLTPGSSLTIYMVAENPPRIEEGIVITSKDGRAARTSAASALDSLIVIACSGLAGGVVAWLLVWLTPGRGRRNISEAERKLTEAWEIVSESRRKLSEIQDKYREIQENRAGGDDRS